METIEQITISCEDFIKFIMEEEPDKKIAMKQMDSSNKCGCIMVHYGKEMLHLDNFMAGCMTIGANHRLEKPLNSFIPVDYEETITYGQLQERIRNQ